MSIVDPKYKRLFALSTFLADPVVLTQAWKKANRYIRRCNWYADMLELDQSAVDLENFVRKWGKDISDKKCEPNPMRLVPAPKSHRWVFKKSEWLPEDTKKSEDTKKPEDTKKSEDTKKLDNTEKEKSDIYLRPLAHLGMREQTMATAAMLCLADCIETAQGDTSVTDYFEARRRHIFSYGNRLYCTFDNDTTGKRGRPLARFSWGNSETYSRYYQDYQRFLARPRVIAENVLDLLGEDEDVYIVKLDIEAFFDRIHRPTLTESLECTYKKHINEYSLNDVKDDSKFWKQFEEIISWDWDKTDNNDEKIWEPIKVKRPKGLPQGLVASGFFANAYLLEFDCEVGKNLSCQKPLATDDLPESMLLHDYCRYVDDLRLVISVKRDRDDNFEKELGENISKWVTTLLTNTIKPYPPKSQDFEKLVINNNKTEISLFRLMKGQVGVSSRMTMIQGDLSGPGDMETLQQTTANLEALLSIATQFDCSGLSDDDAQEPHPLSKVDNPKSEVRDDTIKRFAAYRLKGVLRERRSMTDLDATDGNGIPMRDAIDHEIEMVARKMIRAWSHDPSLSMVLRYAMDLYPSPKLLRLVLDSLRTLTKRESQGQQRIAWYLYADLLRAGAGETGWNVPVGGLPDSADLPGYRATLVNLAEEVLQKNSVSPWYVKQQALMLLATLKPCPSVTINRSLTILRHYRTLLRFAAYKLPETNKPLESEQLVCALVSQQLHPNPERFATWLIQSLKNVEPEQRTAMLQLVSFNRPDLMSTVLTIIDEKEPEWIGKDNAYLRVPKAMHHHDRPLSDLNGCKVALWKVVTRDDNPFQQEILWIKMAIALIGIVPKLHGVEVTSEKDSLRDKWIRFSLRNIKIKVDEWTQILNPTGDKRVIKVEFDDNGTEDPRLELPSWCDQGKESFYVLGRLMRSVITGEEDFTVTPYLSRHDWDGYRGMRNSWYSRRQGLMNSPESLATEAAPFSPWISELLMRLLQWPGVEMTDRFVDGWEKVETLDDLKVLLQRRLKQLADLFGSASNLPIYPIPISHKLSGEGRTLRVALVQTLVPQRDDFSKADPSLDNPTFRPKHQRHIREICNLVIKHLKVQQTSGTAKPRKDDDPLANLIVFPELSVHRDDIWILKRLSDKTKAIIVVGLNLRRMKSGSYVNEVCWLIPDRRTVGRSWSTRFQGKQHPTSLETELGVVGLRPYQLVFEIDVGSSRGYRMTSAICYDATDLKLSADLKNVSDLYVIPAFNQDVNTFDNMVAALHYHMYQHIVLVNTGQYGGSTVQAPFSEGHAKIIAHLHGGGQAGVSIADIDVTDFGAGATLSTPTRNKKKPPANFNRFK
ncbi:MAG: hypothetical protein HQL78_04500 [Magnetococcales bacterium]|nr:hypothetical protein [Magnetococcales bacterium]